MANLPPERRATARKLFAGESQLKTMARQLFQVLDQDNVGILTRIELEKALEEMGVVEDDTTIMDSVFTKQKYDFDEFWLGFEELLRIQGNKKEEKKDNIENNNDNKDDNDDTIGVETAHPIAPGLRKRMSLPTDSLAVTKPGSVGQKSKTTRTLKKKMGNLLSVSAAEKAKRLFKSLAKGTSADMAGQLFQVLDLDGDGELTREEMKLAMEEMDPEHFSPERVDFLFDRLDVDEDNSISIDEFRGGFSLFISGGGEEFVETQKTHEALVFAPEIIEAFHKVDTSMSGYISPFDVKRALEPIIGRPLLSEELYHIEEYIDSEGATEVDLHLFNEIVHLWTHSAKANENDKNQAGQQYEDMSHGELIGSITDLHHHLQHAEATIVRLKTKLAMVAHAHDVVDQENGDMQREVRLAKEKLHDMKLIADEYKDRMLEFKQLTEKQKLEAKEKAKIYADKDEDYKEAELMIEELERDIARKKAHMKDMEKELEELTRQQTRMQRSTRSATMAQTYAMQQHQAQLRELKQRVAELEDLDKDVKVYQDEIERLHKQEEEQRKLLDAMRETVATLRESMKNHSAINPMALLNSPSGALTDELKDHLGEEEKLRVLNVEDDEELSDVEGIIVVEDSIVGVAPDEEPDDILNLEISSVSGNSDYEPIGVESISDPGELDIIFGQEDIPTRFTRAPSVTDLEVEKQIIVLNNNEENNVDKKIKKKVPITPDSDNVMVWMYLKEKPYVNKLNSEKLSNYNGHQLLAAPLSELKELCEDEDTAQLLFADIQDLRANQDEDDCKQLIIDLNSSPDDVEEYFLQRPYAGSINRDILATLDGKSLLLASSDRVLELANDDEEIAELINNDIQYLAVASGAIEIIRKMQPTSNNIKKTKERKKSRKPRIIPITVLAPNRPLHVSPLSTPAAVWAYLSSRPYGQIVDKSRCKKMSGQELFGLEKNELKSLILNASVSDENALLTDIKLLHRLHPLLINETSSPEQIYSYFARKPYGRKLNSDSFENLDGIKLSLLDDAGIACLFNSDDPDPRYISAIRNDINRMNAAKSLIDIPPISQQSTNDDVEIYLKNKTYKDIIHKVLSDNIDGKKFLSISKSELEEIQTIDPEAAQILTIDLVQLHKAQPPIINESSTSDRIWTVLSEQSYGNDLNEEKIRTLTGQTLDSITSDNIHEYVLNDNAIEPLLSDIKYYQAANRYTNMPPITKDSTPIAVKHFIKSQPYGDSINYETIESLDGTALLSIPSQEIQMYFPTEDTNLIEVVRMDLQELHADQIIDENVEPAIVEAAMSYGATETERAMQIELNRLRNEVRLLAEEKRLVENNPLVELKESEADSSRLVLKMETLQKKVNELESEKKRIELEAQEKFEKLQQDNNNNNNDNIITKEKTVEKIIEVNSPEMKEEIQRLKQEVEDLALAKQKVEEEEERIKMEAEQKNNEMTEAMKKLQDEVDRLTAEKFDVQSKKLNRRENLDMQQLEAMAMQQKVEKLKEELSKLSDEKRKALENNSSIDHDAIDKEIAEKTREAEHLSAQKTLVIDEAVNGRKEQMQDAQQRIAQLTSELATIRSQQEKARQNPTSQLEAVKYEKDIRNLKKQVADAEAEKKKAIDEAMSLKKTEITSAQSEMGRLRDRILELNQEKMNLGKYDDEQRKVIANEMELLREQVNKLDKEKLDAIQEAVKIKMDANNAVQDEVANLKQQIIDLTALQRTEDDKNSKATQAAIDELQEKVDDLTKEKRKMYQEAVDLKRAQGIVAQKDVERLNEQIKLLERERSKLSDDEIAKEHAMQLELEELRNQVASAFETKVQALEEAVSMRIKEANQAHLELKDIKSQILAVKADKRAAETNNDEDKVSQLNGKLMVLEQHAIEMAEEKTMAVKEAIDLKSRESGIIQDEIENMDIMLSELIEERDHGNIEEGEEDYLDDKIDETREKIEELKQAKEKVLQQAEILKKKQLAASKADTKEWKKQLAQLGREKLRLEFSGADKQQVELMEGKIKDLMEQMVDANAERKQIEGLHAAVDFLSEENKKTEGLQAAVDFLVEENKRLEMELAVANKKIKEVKIDQTPEEVWQKFEEMPYAKSLVKEKFEAVDAKELMAMKPEELDDMVTDEAAARQLKVDIAALKKQVRYDPNNPKFKPPPPYVTRDSDNDALWEVLKDKPYAEKLDVEKIKALDGQQVMELNNEDMSEFFIESGGTEAELLSADIRVIQKVAERAEIREARIVEEEKDKKATVASEAKAQKRQEESQKITEESKKRSTRGKELIAKLKADVGSLTKQWYQKVKMKKMEKELKQMREREALSKKELEKMKRLQSTLARGLMRASVKRVITDNKNTNNNDEDNKNDNVSDEEQTAMLAELKRELAEKEAKIQEKQKDLEQKQKILGEREQEIVRRESMKSIAINSNAYVDTGDDQSLKEELEKIARDKQLLEEKLKRLDEEKDKLQHAKEMLMSQVAALSEEKQELEDEKKSLLETKQRLEIIRTGLADRVRLEKQRAEEAENSGCAIM